MQASTDDPKSHAAGRSDGVMSAELAQYRLNLSSLLGACRSPEELDRLAADAVAFRAASMQRLDARVHALRRHFTADAAAGTHADVATEAPCLGRDDLERLRAAVDRHGSVLIAAFHFSDHRRLLVDLACLEVPVVAPIAGAAFFEQAAALSAAPADIRDCLRLLDVDSPRVGRDLVRSVREGRIGVIYVDGNMGPGDQLASDGSVDVEFLGHSMRVKCGIARLAAGLQLPIVPVLLQPAGDGTSCRAQLGDTIPPPPKADIGTSTQPLMQALYDSLADRVRVAPEQWEFMFCVHRWLNPEADTGRSESGDVMVAPVTVDPARVTTYRRGDALFWVHLGRQQAYRMPAWSDGLFERLRTRPTTHDDIDRLLVDAPRGAATELMQQLQQRGLLCTAASPEARSTTPARNE